MFIFHQLNKRSVIEVRAKFPFGVPESLEILDRYVDSSSVCIFFQISENIRQLECQSQIDGVFTGAGRLVPEYFDTYQTYCRSGSIAVFAQIGERLVAMPFKIHFHSVDQIEERLLRQIELLDRSQKFLTEFARRAALKYRFHFASPKFKLSVRIAPCGILIDHVIQKATEGVHILDCVPLGARQQQKGVVEI